VPLGETDRAHCLYCNAEVPIPADHLALRAADRAHTRGREQAQELYLRLGEPPGRLLQFWARAGTIALWCLLPLVPGSLLLWMMVVSEAWRLAPYVGFQPVDVIGGAPLSILLGVAVFFLVVFPVVLVARARHVAKTRQMLQSALAARPPERPGGPAGCRNCGAALDVPAGALGVRCFYCREHNLVAIPSGWIRHARKRSRDLHLQLDAAAAEERAQRVRADKLTRRALIASGAALSVLTLAASVLSSGPSWRAYHAASPRAFHSNNMYQPDVTEQKDVKLPFRECHPGCCDIVYMVALAEGETSRLVFLHGQKVPDVTYMPSYIGGAPIFDAAFGASGASVFRAPWSGWFTLTFRHEGSCPDPREWALRWELDAAK
jgi:hypothetical protein